MKEVDEMELVSTAKTTKDYIKWEDREKKDSLKSKPLHRELINIVDELVEEGDVSLVLAIAENKFLHEGCVF